MLDISMIRDEPDRVRHALAKRGVLVDLDELLVLDTDYRGARAEAERLRARRNTLSEQIARLRNDGTEFSALRAESLAISEQLAVCEARLADLEAARGGLLDAFPNLPDDDVLAGGKENNQVVRVSGRKPRFTFTARDHVALAESLRLIDYHRGTVMGGNGFWVYRGEGALLEWSLLNYFIEAHQREGYEFILPPHILGPEAGYVAGQFPKFAQDVYTVDGTQHFMLPTSETALVNLHRGETLPEAELPKKYFAYSPCYRKEIGGYRSTERGTLRGHQFHKVEMFQFAHPRDSDTAHHELLTRAEKLVADLGLHYRVTDLAAGDLSAAMTRTFDVEVWMPSIDSYIEVSSISNARDYQSRRGNIRYRPAQGKAAHVHTLNGSGLATSRLLPAILEQHQRQDGSVRVPDVLRKWGLGATLTPRVFNN